MLWRSCRPPALRRFRLRHAELAEVRQRVVIAGGSARFACDLISKHEFNLQANESQGFVERLKHLELSGLYDEHCDGAVRESF